VLPPLFNWRSTGLPGGTFPSLDVTIRSALSSSRPLRSVSTLGALTAFAGSASSVISLTLWRFHGHPRASMRLGVMAKTNAMTANQLKRFIGSSF
jgi:hypothetical protein